jgi:G3E family GTPase
LSEVNRIPVTVLTGFLGSGKTTLLNRILTESHGQRIAVIENEFGEIGVDQELVIDAEEEIFEMNNGCICCTVRGDLIRILGNLITRRDKFDRIVLETTGLANPGPVAQTFFVDEGMRKEFALDGIVTLVDALHFDRQARGQRGDTDAGGIRRCHRAEQDRSGRRGAARRRGAASAFHQRAGENRARRPYAQRAAVPMKAVLGIGGFDLARALEYKPTFLEPEYPFEWAGVYELAAGDYTMTLEEGPDPAMKVVLCESSGTGDADPGRAAERVFKLFSGSRRVQGTRRGDRTSAGCAAAWIWRTAARSDSYCVLPGAHGKYWLVTQHLPEEFAIETSRRPRDLELTARRPKELRPGPLARFTSRLVQSGDGPADRPRPVPIVAHGHSCRLKGTRLYRMKGFLDFAGSNQRIVIQGVHMVVDTSALGPWGGRPRLTQLVFIGRELDRELLDARLRGLPCGRRRGSFLVSFKGRLIALYGVLICANLAVAGWAFVLFAGDSVKLGTALLAYSLGLRHAVDADHIAAIDNVTRKLIQDGKRPITVGFYFAIGHSTIVLIAACCIAFTVGALAHFEDFSRIGSVIATATSATFLFAIAAMNLLILRSVWRRFDIVRREGKYTPDDLDMLAERTRPAVAAVSAAVCIDSP